MSKKATTFTLAAGIVILIIVLLWWMDTNQVSEPETMPPGTNTENTTSSNEAPADEEDATPAAASQPAIAASAQPANIAAVTIDQAVLPAGGYIVIHENEEQQPGAVVGHSDYLDPAAYTNFTVLLDRDTQAGETLYAMLHTDDGNQTYDFPGPDAPLRNDTGLVVITSFTIEEDEAANLRVDTNLETETTIE